MSFNKLSNGQNDTINTPSPTLSPTSTLMEDSPHAPVRHRPTFARLASVLDESQPRYQGLAKEEDITETPTHREEYSSSGLGISFASKVHSLEDSPGTTLANTLSTAYDSGAPHNPGSAYWSSPGQAKRSVSSFQSSLQQGFTSPSETQPLRVQRSFTDTLRKTYEGFSPHDSCPSREKANQSRFNSTAIIVLVLSIYSTIFSCIYLIIAACGPRYGKHIGSSGSLSAANANLLAALIAKTIEISFATVFVAFLGQILWRRASGKSRRHGVTLAEMEMRQWVMQPGTMLTRFVAIRSSILSLLGLLSLTAAVVAMLYTTASEALVQPQLRFGHWEQRPMQGSVSSSWGNAQYLEQQCQSPTVKLDPSPLDGVETCMEMKYAAQAYHDFQRFISDWYVEASSGNMSSELSKRPQGFALMTENTTVNAQWIELATASGAAEADGRTVNNISMAMPHAGVTSAARDSTNGILQPQDLDGLGVYSLHASVPSPAINVLCANMEEEELTPIVYDEWTDGGFNSSTWFSEQINTVGPDLINNKTVVDDIFGWGAKYGHAPPVFGKLPIAFNTVLNDTGPYGREAIYVLGNGATGTDYVLCSIKAYLTPHCSSRYNVSSSGATLEALCEDPTDRMQYLHSVTNATSGNSTINKDWVAVAQDWSSSLSLDAGINDANASIARLLTQLILPEVDTTSTSPALSAELPSPAEALAVLAGCTLLMGTQDAPFVQSFNYTAPSNILSTPQHQFFNASLRTQEYASGGSKGYQHGFYIVLIAVFLLNVVCLAYLVAKKGMVTDFSEPVNLFSLAVNSPPSDVMAGSCGGGPEACQFVLPWCIHSAGEHMYIEHGGRRDEEDGEEEEEEEEEEEGSGRETARSGTYLEELSPVGRAFKRFSARTSSLLS